MSSWQEFWNADNGILVSERHREVHFLTLADEVMRLLPAGRPWVLDYGCGDTPVAGRIAHSCGRLVLCDGAALVRRRLSRRYGLETAISVLAPADLGRFPAGAFDVVIVNSVVQYFSPGELQSALAEWRRLLADGGRLVLGDIIPRTAGSISDVIALLRLAAANGFLLAAIAGLVRTAMSDYRKTRLALGLLKLDEAELIEVLHRAGFKGRRAASNLGHDQARMTFVAQPYVETLCSRSHRAGPAPDSMAPPRHAAGMGPVHVTNSGAAE